nr:MAG TPA: Major capsid protein [Microviridae sp.]
MANGAFDATLDVNNEIKVNNFDWSHANNLTTQIGRVTPVFCELVPAHGSVRINPRFGLQFMPMVFPIQTRLRARMMFFKFPLRALWDGYRDFIGNFREDLEEPYLDMFTEDHIKAMAKTGSLGDYLGLPTTLVGDFGAGTDMGSPTFTIASVKGNQFGGSSSFTYLPGLPLTNLSNYSDFYRLSPTPLEVAMTSGSSITVPSPGSASATDNIRLVPHLHYDFTTDDGPVTRSSVVTIQIPTHPGKVKQSDFSKFGNYVTVFVSNNSATGVMSYVGCVQKDGALHLSYSFPQSFIDSKVEGFSLDLYMNILSRFGRRISGSTTAWDSELTPLGELLTDGSFKSGVQSSGWNWSMANVLSGNTSQYVATYKLNNGAPVDLTIKTSPYYNHLSVNSQNQIKISAYACRAYEGIYNAYIRDNRNNPYYVNGQVQYNKWIPTYDGGADTNIYQLRYANWEKDFLTTAVQSPQQGTAPLVGITTYTETVDSVDDSGQPVVRELSRIALVDEDGKKYQVSFDSDDEGLKGVSYVELDNEVKMRQPRNLIDVVTSGISINDLRNVNAYQKFLELNMRKGYSYRDIIEGRFNVKVRYDELLMPEFFGGFSRDIEMHSISQTVDQDVAGTQTYAKALGSQSGIAGVRGDSGRALECFCDEESIVMGILIVTPLPVYTQLLPKHFTYRGLLDHYQPEFNHIGFQPILYKEVCPIQAYNELPETIHDVFGYNRPWYEYVQKYDQAHGLFRSNLSNFLMNRVFNQKPELAQSFLVIDPEQVTDVFAVTKADDGTDLTDKIYGQIWFDCTAKLPISRVAIPRLD